MHFRIHPCSFHRTFLWDFMGQISKTSKKWFWDFIGDILKYHHWWNHLMFCFEDFRKKNDDMFYICSKISPWKIVGFHWQFMGNSSFFFPQGFHVASSWCFHHQIWWENAMKIRDVHRDFRGTKNKNLVDWNIKHGILKRRLNSPVGDWTLPLWKIWSQLGWWHSQ